MKLAFSSIVTATVWAIWSTASSLVAAQECMPCADGVDDFLVGPVCGEAEELALQSQDGKLLNVKDDAHVENN